MINLPKKLILTILTAFVPFQLSAVPAPIVSPSPFVTSQGLQRYTYGYQLQANSNLMITALGSYHTAAIPMNFNKPVGVWDSLGNLLTSTTVLTTDTISGNYRYQTLSSPITINAGEIFYLAGLNVASTAASSTVPVVSAANAPTTLFSGVTLLDYRRSPNTSPVNSQGVLTFPSLDTIASPALLDLNPVLANAMIEVVTPEPSTYLLMGSMLLGVGLLLVYKRKTKVSAS